MYLKTVALDEATGFVADQYQADITSRGFAMNATRAWTTRPEVQRAWGEFVGTVRQGSELSARDWRLITFIAAKHIRSTYCSLEYGRQLLQDLGGTEQVMEVQRDFRSAGLSPRDVAMLDYAEKVTVDAPSISAEDVERLRQHGFSDAGIYDIAMCAAIRNLASRFFDAVGATPDQTHHDLPAELRDQLCVGRPLGV